MLSSHSLMLIPRVSIKTLKLITNKVVTQAMNKQCTSLINPTLTRKHHIHSKDNERREETQWNEALPSY